MSAALLLFKIVAKKSHVRVLGKHVALHLKNKWDVSFWNERIFRYVCSIIINIICNMYIITYVVCTYNYVTYFHYFIRLIIM